MESMTIPDFFKPLLWSYDSSRIDPARDQRLIIVATINYGQWRHWQWLARAYGAQTLRRAIAEIPASEFRPQALKLAALLFRVGAMKYASRSAYLRHQSPLASS